MIHLEYMKDKEQAEVLDAALCSRKELLYYLIPVQEPESSVERVFLPPEEP